MKQIFIFCMTVFLLASCHKENITQGDDPTPEPVGDVTITAIGQPAGIAVQKVIGVAGGAIVSADGKAKLVIPAGALTGDETISMQAIEGTAPGNIKTGAYRFGPHGLTFKKPAQLVINYTEAMLQGSTPELFYVATQQANGGWKMAGKSVVDKGEKVITTNIAHFSDYDLFSQFALEDNRTHTDTATVSLLCSEEVTFHLQQVEFTDDSMLFVHLYPERYVKEWTVNGMASPPVASVYGYFKSEPDSRNKTYIAPIKAPQKDTVTISVQLDLDSKGAFFLVRNVVIVDQNRLRINGKWLGNITAAASFVNGTLYMTLTDMTIPLKPVGASVMVSGITGPGVYPFSSLATIVASDDGFPPKDWSSWYDNNGAIVYGGGGITITQGGAPGQTLAGHIDGDLFHIAGTNKPVETTNIYASFGMLAH